MTRFANLKNLRSTEGSQIVEFAVSLPLLVVLVVGIFDFGAAFNLKQKIHNAALLAARTGASQTTRDLSLTGNCGTPDSVCAIRDTVANSLTAAKVNDCGLDSATGSSTGPLTWTFTANSGCPGTLTLTVNRGFLYTTTLVAPFEANYTIEGTRATVSYPYRWQFSSVIQLVTPSANYPGSSQIHSTATVPNLN
ncbi:MAG TPA: TadE/TadG family type IV pilus assembly protein [Terriglobales bacterium]|nr:TadE/TadG family type IV pilus assembly protein [Terriglobales bacterium]